jgi:hypothetical protein
VEDTAEDFFALVAGTRVDEYKIISVLGRGSFGITYLAEDVNLGVRLALKEYLPGDCAVRDSTRSVRPKSAAVRKTFEWGMDAFLKEARTLASISHPNIVKVRRFFRASGTAYIVMEFVEGRAFGDVLANDYPSGGFPTSSLNSLLLSLLDGLAAVHQAGIIHRDVKPGNILIEPNGNPILIDFGAARSFQRTLASGMTVIMTLGYAPIEQYSEGGEQGPFTDFYSLGSVAYRAITGHAPMEPYKRLSGEAFSSARSIGAGRYPTPLLAAIDWAIQVNPKDRPQSASALSAMLTSEDTDTTRVIERYDSRERAAKLVETHVHPSRGGVLRAVSRRRAAQIAVIAAVVGAAFVALATYRGTWFGAGGQDVAEHARPNEAAQQETNRRAAEAAAKQEADRKAVEAAARQEADRKATAAKQEADRIAAEAAARQEADRKAAEAAAKEEADRIAAEAAAKQEAERNAAEAAAKQEADRKAAEVAERKEADRKAAEAAAKRLADRKAAEAAAKRQADRKAAEAAAQQEAEKRAQYEAQQQAQKRQQELDEQRRQQAAPAAIDYCQGRSFACYFGPGR